MSASSHQLYQLIISQLKDDGFTTAAQAVTSATMVPPPTENYTKGRLEKVKFFQNTSFHHRLLFFNKVDFKS